MSPPRSILITGASSGIGEALACHYAESGVSLFLSGRNKERLAGVAAACEAQGATVYVSTVDVTDRDQMARWITDIDRETALDLVVANAGISGGTADGIESETQTRSIFAVNVDGVLNTVLPALKAMAARSAGQIAIVSSLAGFLQLPGAPAYSASKAAVRHFGEALRPSAARRGVGVTVICPGFVHSRITAANPFPMPFIMPADRAAKIIARGLEKNSTRVAFPWIMYAVVYTLGQLVPPPILRMLLSRLPEKPAAAATTGI